MVSWQEFLLLLEKVKWKKGSRQWSWSNRGRLRARPRTSQVKDKVQHAHMESGAVVKGIHMQDKKEFGTGHGRTGVCLKGFLSISREHHDKVLIQFHWPKSPDIFCTHPCLLQAGSRK